MNEKEIIGPIFEECYDCNKNGNCKFQEDEEEENCEIIQAGEENECS